MPLVVLLSWFTQNQFEQRLHSFSEHQQVIEYGRVKREFVATLSERRDELLQIRTALELDQPQVLEHLLARNYFERLRILVINHYGELHPLLPQNRAIDSSTASLLEQLARPLEQETFQFERSGFAQLQNNEFALITLPLKHRQWRGIVLVQSIGDEQMLALIQSHANLKSATLTRASKSPQEQQLPMLFGKPLALQLQFDLDAINNFTSQAAAVFMQTMLLALSVLLGLYLLQRRLLLQPLSSFVARLQQVRDRDVSAPLPVATGTELGQLAQDCNELFRQRHQQQRQRDSLLRAVNDAVVVVDNDARIELVNPAAEILLAVEHGPVQHCTLQELVAGEAGAQLDNDLRELLNSSRVSLDSEVQLPKSGEVLKYSVVRTLDGQGQTLGAVMVMRDMTKNLQLKMQLQHRTQRDSTTKLFNRQVFERELEELANKPGQHAVIYMDLNRFKLINDSCGHTAGDRMLHDVSAEMRQNIRNQDILARIGGDEFGLIMPDSSALEVAKVLKNLSERVQGITLYWDSGSYKVGISIGVAFYRGEQTPYETFKDAEIACSVTKAKGGEGQIHFFDSLDQDLAHQRNAPLWAMKINDAIVNDDLVLFYQPIEPTDGNNNGKRKCEILLRIKEEGGRILAPGQFIAAAERFNLMPQVDRAVIRKSFEWLARNPHLWDSQVISINLSGTTLNSDGLVSYVEQMVKTYRVPTHTVCFEVTETAALTNENHALEILNELRRRGFAFSLDDFGSGFASYGYLRRLPVDYVKIDGVFVQNLATDDKDYAIVKSIHDVCQVMGIETVAEFVEDQETLERLQEIGVTYAQGYGIGRPKDLATYEPLGNADDALLQSLLS